MKEKSESLTAADFFEKLQHDKLDTTVPFSIIGMVKKSEGKEKTIEFAPGGNCSNWVTIPIEFIEDVEVLKTISCKDHSHPLVKLNMKTPKNQEGKIFFGLLESFKQSIDEMRHSHSAPEMRHSYAPPEMSYGYDAPEMRHGYDAPSSGYTELGMKSSTSSIARMSGGRGLSSGLGIGGGGLNAWGCWNSTCCTDWGTCCIPTPRGRKCWACCRSSEPCERCIWPY